MKIKVPYVVITKEILLNKSLTDREKNIITYLVMLTNNSDDNKVYLSQSRIIDDLNISHNRYLIAAINHLEELGYITVIHNNPHKKQKGVANCYIVNYDKINKVDSAIESKTETECSDIQVECESELQNNNSTEVIIEADENQSVDLDDYDISISHSDNYTSMSAQQNICKVILSLQDIDYKADYYKGERDKLYNTAKKELNVEFDWLKNNDIKAWNDTNRRWEYYYSTYRPR